ARDMNGDGIADLVTRQDLYTVLWLAGAGNGTFTLGGTVTAPQVFARVRLIDADTDGDPDLLLNASNGAFLTMHDGAGSFGSLVQISITGQYIVRDGDLNGEMINELVVGGLSSQDIDIWVPDGNGSFEF